VLSYLENMSVAVGKVSQDVDSSCAQSPFRSSPMCFGLFIIRKGTRVIPSVYDMARLVESDLTADSNHIDTHWTHRLQPVETITEGFEATRSG
jgi:hypothetical protein